MYKSIDTQALNSVVITGSLLNLELREGKTKKDAKPYRAANASVRVNQFYGGKEETSEIPLSFIAMKFKKDGTNNPVFDTLGGYANEYKTAERNGLEAATHVQINGRRGNGQLSENMFVDNRNPENVISSWNIRASFLNEVRSNTAVSGADCATFDVEIFILNLEREVSAMGEETGRLKIRGGIVQWGRSLDVLDFYVEDPSAVDYIERNYNINDTVHVVGRVRYTSEINTYQVENSWGEAIPQTTTKKKHELIITHGDDEPLPEERAYDPEDIRVLVADRTARKEQKKMEAKSKPAQKPAEVAPTTTKYGWED